MAIMIISEKQLFKLQETAMDLDIYVQPVSHSASNGNEDLEDTIDDTIQKLQELQSMFKTGRHISSETESVFFNAITELNKVYENIKYQDRFTSL